jgi:hypothetical protein
MPLKNQGFPDGSDDPRKSGLEDLMNDANEDARKVAASDRWKEYPSRRQDCDEEEAYS